MKNALILHGTGGTSHTNWFAWLGTELEKRGYNVWVPDLPAADKPNIQRYNDFLFSRADWQFNQETLLIGHSSGAVAILGLLQALPEGQKVKSCYLVGAFKDDLGWESLKDLFAEQLDYKKIKTKANRFVFIHSDNDPYCPLEHAQFLSQQLGGELIVLPGQQHFGIKSGGPQYRQFPFLIEQIESEQ